MKQKALFALLLATAATCPSLAQSGKSLVSGPMLGHTTMRTAIIWAQFSPEVKSAQVRFGKDSNSAQEFVAPMKLSSGEFNTASATLTGLDPGTSYRYSVVAAGKEVATGKLSTQQLWQWRKPPPDFSFLTGSCAYFNEAVFDRPGKPYGLDSSIFETMAHENANFMLWLGDNWYTREADYFSEWGLYYRASHDRSENILQPLLKKMPQYAIWDDHDFGPDNSGESYPLKNFSRDVFMKYWNNPSYGRAENGVFTRLRWNDIDLFLLDDRWWRSNDARQDSISGQPNPSKKMFGKEQMEWLKDELTFSKESQGVTFRIIVTGSQVLNEWSPTDCLRHFPAEYHELMDFLQAENIPGIIFLTGDRHHSEVIRQERKNSYPLFDVTVSPLTSSIAKTSAHEANNPARVGNEIDQQNYARFAFTGSLAERRLTVTFVGLKGESLGTWSVASSELEKAKKR